MDTLRLLVAEPASQGSRMKTRKVFPVLQLFAAVLVALFLAGIVAPSILRYELAGNRALASGSLHSLTIAHITFTYTFWNLASAVLGALFGAAVVARVLPFVSALPLESIVHFRTYRRNGGSSAKTIGQPTSGATTWRDLGSTPVD